MSVQKMLEPPACHAHFPAEEYLHLRLWDDEGTYAFAAVAERGDCLELHLESVRWGPRARRGLARDLDWLKARARRLGKARIAGLREVPVPPGGEGAGEPDPHWFKFTRLFGFSGQCVLQAAFLELDERDALLVSAVKKNDPGRGGSNGSGSKEFRATGPERPAVRPLTRGRAPA